MFTEMLYDDETNPIGLRLLGPTREDFELMAQIIGQGPQVLVDGPNAWILKPAHEGPDDLPEFTLGSGEWIG